MQKLKIIILFFLIVGTLRIKAQCSITLTDLERLCKESSLTFEIAVLGKGFHLYKDGSKPYPHKIYLCDTLKSDSSTDQIEYSILSNENLIIDYTTTNDQFNSKIWDSLPIKNYTFLKKDIVKQINHNSKTTCYHYRKGTIYLDLYTIEVFGKIKYTVEMKIEK